MSGPGGGKSRTDGQSTKPSEIQWMLCNMFTCRLVSWKWQEDFRFHFQWDKARFCSKWILLRPLAEGLFILGKAKYKEETFHPVLYPPSGLWQCAQPSAGRTKFFLSFSCSLWLMSRTIHPIHNHVSDFLKGSQLEKPADGWEIPTCCLQAVWGLLSWFFQESHVDKSSSHATLCTLSKTPSCSWLNYRRAEWFKRNVLQVSLRLKELDTYVKTEKLHVKFRSDSMDMRLSVSAKTWKLIHLSIILWIQNWVVEKALKFFSWTYHLFISSVILGFPVNYSFL